jgi:hypothetical protein
MPRSDQVGMGNAVQTLMYHASQIEEIARFLGDGGVLSNRLGPGMSMDFVASQLAGRLQRKTVSAQICLSVRLPEESADPLDAVYRELIRGKSETRILVSRSLVADNPCGSWLFPENYENCPITRVAARDLPALVIVDDSVALLGDSFAKQVVVLDRVTVRYLKEFFEAVWHCSPDLALITDVDSARLADYVTEDDGPRGRVLPLLAEGLTDEAAAQKLDWSVRTYRRYVAELMRLLSAKSRFQAGIRVAQLRLRHLTQD